MRGGCFRGHLKWWMYLEELGAHANLNQVLHGSKEGGKHNWMMDFFNPSTSFKNDSVDAIPLISKFTSTLPVKVNCCIL